MYCNQVFVTDSLEGVVPDFLALLQGVIDSPDIPLNVSRSALQSDSNVKKILNNPERDSLDDDINLGVYKPDLKTTNIIKTKIKNISKIIKEIKKLK